MKKLKTADVATVSLGAAFMCICSWIQVPSAVPFTLQTFAVFFLSAAFGTKRSLASIIIYILLGIVGVPVFSGFQGGFSALAGPTGGFIFGFIPAAAIIGFSSQRYGIKFLPSFISCTLALLTCYIPGILWYAFIFGTSLLSSALICIVPFIAPDVLKIFLAVTLSKRISPIIKNKKEL